MCEWELILNVGSRFDDRILGQPDSFCQDATIVHIDIDAAEVGKICLLYTSPSPRDEL